MRLLVVDDDLACREFICRLFDETAECHRALGGLQAIDLVRQSHQWRRLYDLLLLDATLPDMDPRSVVRAVRNLERQAAIAASQRLRVIVLTSPWLGQADEVVLPEDRAAHLAKPRPLDEAALKAAVESTAGLLCVAAGNGHAAAGTSSGLR